MKILIIFLIFFLVLLSSCSKDNVVIVENINSSCQNYLSYKTDYLIQTIQVNFTHLNSFGVNYDIKENDAEIQIQVVDKNLQSIFETRKILKKGTSQTEFNLLNLKVFPKETYLIKINCPNCSLGLSLGNISCRGVPCPPQNAVCFYQRYDNPFKFGNLSIFLFNPNRTSIDPSQDLIFSLGGVNE